MFKIIGLTKKSLKKHLSVSFIVALMGIIFCNSSWAVIRARSLATDGRIKVVRFQKNNVVPLVASTFTTAQVVFGQDEVIENIQNGDMAAWTVNVQKELPNMLFLKPTITGSNTNMTVITNKRTYYFHLKSQPENTRRQVDNIYAIRFSYPDENRVKMFAKINFVKQQKKAIINAKMSPKSYNWDYTFSGCRAIMPLHIFDDGKFTYLQLQPNQSVPAIFSVDNSKGDESVVNYRREGDYIVIQQMSPQFTLRHGAHQVVSIFNTKIIKQLKSKGEYR